MQTDWTTEQWTNCLSDILDEAGLWGPAEAARAVKAYSCTNFVHLASGHNIIYSPLTSTKQGNLKEEQ